MVECLWGVTSKSIISPQEQGARQLGLDHVSRCGLVCFWISERHLLQRRPRLLRCCQGGTHGEQFLQKHFRVGQNEMAVQCISRLTCFQFVARYSGNGSRPQTDSIAGPDLLHNHLPDCVDPRRLPEYCQLFQVMVRSLLHALCIVIYIWESI